MHMPIMARDRRGSARREGKPVLEYPDRYFPFGTPQGRLSEGEDNVKAQLFAPGHG